MKWILIFFTISQLTYGSVSIPLDIKTLSTFKTEAECVLAKVKFDSNNHDDALIAKCVGIPTQKGG